LTPPGLIDSLVRIAELRFALWNGPREGFDPRVDDAYTFQFIDQLEDMGMHAQLGVPGY